jgi:hypothetical protein
MNARLNSAAKKVGMNDVTMQAIELVCTWLRSQGAFGGVIADLVEKYLLHTAGDA